MPALPWLDWDSHYSSNGTHPRENFADFTNNPWSGVSYHEYGRDVMEKFAIAVSWLNTNQPLADKQRIANKIIQQGLDIYSYVTNVPTLPFYANGGLKCGRKLPTIFAAVMLGDSDILATCQQQSPPAFQEDQQVFFVTGADLVAPRAPHVYDPAKGDTVVEYTTADTLPGVEAWNTPSLPEWGFSHYYEPHNDNRNWGVSYRDVNTAPLLSVMTAVNLMGIETQWNNPASVAYARRYQAIGADGWGTIHHHAAFNRFLWANHYTPS
jgi:hypothetical protein